MKVLVLGGTGAMGAHLVDILSKSGINTVVTSRAEHKPKMNVCYLQGDAKNIEFLCSLLHDSWDAIIDFMIYDTPMFRARVDLLLKATSQYVFLSSARVYANEVSPVIEETPRLLDVSNDTSFLSTDEYSLTKARQEDILRNSGEKNWTIVRLYITYSEIRLQLGVLEKEEWLYRALHGRTIFFSEDMLSKATTMTYGLDVAKGIVAIVGEPDTLGKTFHITATESKTWQEILFIYMDVLEKHLGYKPVVTLQRTRDFLKWRPAKYQVIYDRLFDRVFDNSKINRYINTSGFSSVESDLRRCLEQFLKNPKFKIIDWKAEALKDRYTNEYTPLGEIRGLKQKVKYVIFRYFPQL